MFWIVAGLLTLAASLAVLLPLTGPAEADDERERAMAVYRDQLAEVERDRERGLITADAAAEARAEIGRRLLKLDAAGRPTEAGRVLAGTANARRLFVAAAVMFVPLASWGLYAATGSPDQPAQPLAARLAQPPRDGTVEELLTRAEAHLMANPQDGRGWGVVAPIYLRLERFDEAATAYRSAIGLDGASADREAGLGEALAGAAGGTVTPDARAAFERAMKLEPRHLLARFQLAAADAQAGKRAEASQAWRAMLGEVPDGSPWRAVLNGAIASLGAGPEAPAKGPTEAQVAEAQTLSEADRAAMIEAMVSSLDQRLRDNPEDADGWMRLVRSYMVLEQADKARDALSRGRQALGSGSEAEARLAALAASLGLSEAVQQ